MTLEARQVLPAPCANAFVGFVESVAVRAVVSGATPNAVRQCAAQCEAVVNRYPGASALVEAWRATVACVGKD